MHRELARYAANQIAKIVAAVFFVAFVFGGIFAWFLLS